MIDFIDSVRLIPEEQIPNITIQFFRRRKDKVLSGQSFLDRIRQEALQELNTKHAIVTPNSAPHTNIKMDSPANHNDKIPAHLLIWLNTKTYRLGEIPKVICDSYASAVEKSVNYIHSHTAKTPVIYQLFGARSDSNFHVQNLESRPLNHELGLASAPSATVEYSHIHCALPPDVNTQIVETRPDKLNKYYAPLNIMVFEDLFLAINDILKTTIQEKEVRKFKAESVIEKPFEMDNSTLYNGSAIIERKKRENGPFFDSINIKLPNTTELGDYLTVIYHLFDKLNNIYSTLMDRHSEYYTSNPNSQNQINERYLKDLQKHGLSEKTAQKLLDISLKFKPTLKLLDTWIKSPDTDELARERDTKLRDKFLKRKAVIETKEFKEKLSKRYGETKAEIILSYIRDQLITDNLTTTVNVFAENFPAKWFFVPTIANGKIIVDKGIKIATQIATSGNTIEQIAKTTVDR